MLTAAPEVAVCLRGRGQRPGGGDVQRAVPCHIPCPGCGVGAGQARSRRSRGSPGQARRGEPRAPAQPPGPLVAASRSLVTPRRALRSQWIRATVTPLGEEKAKETMTLELTKICCLNRKHTHPKHQTC